MRKVLVASVLGAVTVVAGHLMAQGRGGNPGVFPAQQRPPGDPAVIERGKGIYVTTCSACHGADLRGGATGGPNLLRSQVVLSDQHGELILPIVHGARAERGMPALPLPDAGRRRRGRVHPQRRRHSHGIRAPRRRARRRRQTRSSATPSAGEAYFKAKCSSCHSPTGDLQGIGTRVPEGKALQNTLGHRYLGGGGRRGGRGAAAAPGPPTRDPRAVIATITLPGGETVQGPVVRMDNFLITVRQADGTQRTIRRMGDTPKVELKDPLAGHKALLAELTDKDMHDVTAYLAGLK